MKSSICVRKRSGENSAARAASASRSQSGSAMLTDGSSHSLWCRLLDEEPVLARPDDVARTAASSAMTGVPGGQSLDHRDPEVLLAHMDEPAARA